MVTDLNSRKPEAVICKFQVLQLKMYRGVLRRGLFSFSHTCVINAIPLLGKILPELAYVSLRGIKLTP